MSGYLDVKYPFKSNLGLNPFKTWKRQWCIVRPSATTGGGSLAVYCSEGGNAAGAVALPHGGMVRLAASRSRPHAFAVFSPRELNKPCILLAATTAAEARLWMDKIRAVLSGENLLGTETLLKDSYSVNVVATELSRKCGLSQGASTLTMSSSGIHLSQSSESTTCIQWKYICDVALITESRDKNKFCVLSIISGFRHGSGDMKLSGAHVSDLAKALKQTLKVQPISKKKLSKSDSDLPTKSGQKNVGDRNSWSKAPSECSSDKKQEESTNKTVSAGADVVDLARVPRAHAAAVADDVMSDRHSLLSVASGIYEEIPEIPSNDTYCPMMATKSALRPTSSCPIDIVSRANTDDNSSPDTIDASPMSERIPSDQDQDTVDAYCPMDRDTYLAMNPEPGYLSMSRERDVLKSITQEEPTYESVAECVYATIRRPGKWFPPPPLPPRLPFGASWGGRGGSLGSLPRCCSAGAADQRAHSLPKKQPFSVFRKRLKSDSRIVNSPKCEPAAENKDTASKKKRFDFTPTRDIFRNFRVSRKGKKMTKEETKSCEFLDSSPPPTTQRSSKSVEFLEKDDLEYDGNLSIEFNDDVVADLALPQEIVELILRTKTQIEHKEPLIPPPQPLDACHYMVMSPKANIA